MSSPKTPKSNNNDKHAGYYIESTKVVAGVAVCTVYKNPRTGHTITEWSIKGRSSIG